MGIFLWFVLQAPHHGKWCRVNRVINQYGVLRQDGHDTTVGQLSPTRLVFLICIGQLKEHRVASDSDCRLWMMTKQANKQTVRIPCTQSLESASIDEQ